MVKDHQTVVIAGLMSDNVTTAVSKIPWLGDIPLLGHLFRATQTTTRKDNLLIVITPHVIRTSRDLEDFYKGKLKEIELTEEASDIARARVMSGPIQQLGVEPGQIIRDDGIRK